MTTWQSTTRRILDGLDLKTEFTALGLDLCGEPNSKGWATCRVFGADDNNPSGGANLTTGRYKEFTGQGRNLSFFEFAALAKPEQFADWKAAREHYRKLLKIKAPKGTAKEPDENLVFRPWNEALVQSWCTKKPPILPEAVQWAGGRLAGWPAKTQQHTVIALPVFGPLGTDGPPCGWVIFNKSGRLLPLFQGKGRPLRPVKMMSVGGSKAGWMGAKGLDLTEKAELVWKVEGPTDMLALTSMMPHKYQERHAIIANSGGSMEHPQDELVAMLKGRRVNVVHDCDVPGQLGGRRWADAIAKVASEVKVVELPFAITKDHGADLRNWLNGVVETETT